MKDKYKQSLSEFLRKDSAVRDLILRIRVHAKAGQPYYVSKKDVVTVNEARTAWLEFLKVARR